MVILRTTGPVWLRSRAFRAGELAVVSCLLFWGFVEAAPDTDTPRRPDPSQTLPPPPPAQERDDTDRIAPEITAPRRPEPAPPASPPLQAPPAVRTTDHTAYIELGRVAAAANLRGKWDGERRRLILSNGALRMEFEGESRAVSFDGVRIFLGEAIQSRGSALYLSTIDYQTAVRPLLFPEAAPPPGGPVRTIVLDPGHGGRDPGARSAVLGIEEKDMTLDVALRLRTLLEARGYRVILTRRDDRYVSLERRARIANMARADLFISIHFNAVDNASVAGAETFVLTPRHHRSTGQGSRRPEDVETHPGNHNDHWNALLGFYVQRQLLHDTGAADRGVKRARFSVLREVESPAVLVEAGYLSNSAEARRIANPAYRQQLAVSLARGVEHYRRTVNRVLQ